MPPRVRTPRSVRPLFLPALLCLLFGYLVTTRNAPDAITLTEETSELTSPEDDFEAEVASEQNLLGALPMHFEANAGQTDEQVHFLARGAGYTVFLTAGEAVLVLRRQTVREQEAAGRDPASLTPAEEAAGAVVRMRLVGANALASFSGQDELAGKSNYFIGNDPTHWHTGVRLYRKVYYESVYAGIDLVFYGTQQALEYDFVVQPGGDPKAITLAFGGLIKGEGAAAVELDGQGELLVHTEGGSMRQPKPMVYQEVGGERREIAGRYVLKEDAQIGFEVGAYDTGQALVIDPVLLYSTYLGGTGHDISRDIALDGSGNVYVTGLTDSGDFPTANPNQATRGGRDDVFVTKLDADGAALVYSTYLGGSGRDHGYGIAVDGKGNAYVTGFTESNDFPTASPAQEQRGGGFEAFVTRLDPTGSMLAYSTYLGGSGNEQGYSIAVDGSGSAYVSGWTGSSDFPTVNPVQATRGGRDDVFVTKLDAAGSSFAYSTYLGGSSADFGRGIAVSGSGNAYITGQTLSTDFPTVNPVQGSHVGVSYDAFVTRLNAAGSALVYSTYLGGNDYDLGFDIAVDGDGNAYVSGSTQSPNFPTANPFQETHQGREDAFVTKLNAGGSALVYSTYLGGSSADQSYAIAVDGTGEAYVTGMTYSSNFPTANPVQGTLHGDDDAFVTRLDATGAALAYSTYLGGSRPDRAHGIAVDGFGNAYITGSTLSSDFPTASPFQEAPRGYEDGFVSKIAVNKPPECSGAAIADQIADAACRAAVSGADVTGVTDPDGHELTITVAPTILALGDNTVRVFADDGHGGSCDTEITVSVADTTPPVLKVEPVSQKLWPPNAFLHVVELAYLVPEVRDNCDADLSDERVVITSVTSDEVLMDGDFKRDVMIGANCRRVSLRAMRWPDLNGRVYMIHLGLLDASGNSGTASSRVYVPIRKNQGAVDDGPAYTAAGCTPEARLPAPAGKSAGDAETRSQAGPGVPAELRLEQNYPNPFNPQTTLYYEVPEASVVRLVVYDVLGRQVRVLVDGQRAAGEHRVVLEAGDLPGGTYLLQLVTPAGSVVRTMQLVR